VADVTAKGAAKSIIAQVEQELGPIDILINNAGTTHVGLLSEEDPDLWWRVQEVNVRAPVSLSCAVLPSMLKRQTGVIISTSSSAAASVSPAMSAQASSKAAISKFHESLAKEIEFSGSSNILTFAVNPGVVWTEMRKSNDNMMNSANSLSN
jgi:short-subunit dehydrogenase